MESKDSPTFIFGSNTFLLSKSPVDFDDLRVINHYDPKEEE